MTSPMDTHEGLLALLEKHVDGVRHYLHLQIGKPPSKDLVSAPEIALDNLRRELAEALTAPSTGDAQGTGWRCFYCNEFFVDRQAAEMHFGRRYEGEPTCVPPKITAKAWASRVEWTRARAIEACAKIAETYGETLAHPATVSHCRAGIAKAIRAMLGEPGAAPVTSTQSHTQELEDEAFRGGLSAEAYAALPSSSLPARGAEGDLAKAINSLIDYAKDLDVTERPAIGEYDVTADIRLVCQALIDRSPAPHAEVREALEPNLRDAIQLFVEDAEGDAWRAFAVYNRKTKHYDFDDEMWKKGRRRQYEAVQIAKRALAPHSLEQEGK